MIKATKKETNLHTLNLNIRVQDILNLPTNQFKKLDANKTYQLSITYPLAKEATFDIETTEFGLDFPDLLSRIAQNYALVYQEPEKYGIWGHGIGDLWIEAIHIDHNKNKIKLSMGS